MVGKTVAHYRIVEKLGQGGMGEVYRAEDKKLKREVALKLLPPRVASNVRRLERFQREAEALAALNHPNIVTVFSVEGADGLRFLTMELVDGETLSERIPEGGMPLERFFETAIPLADALAAAHARGVIHRDLKPANVMVDREGRVKVLDFGLAKEESPETRDSMTHLATEPLTAEGGVLGTPPYMSPEQARGDEVDCRSDLFSLGSVLYKMATGKRPFEGASKAELTSAILRDAPPSVNELRAELPGQLGRIVRHCLEKDPRHRFQTALDVRNELEDLRQELTTQEKLAPAAEARATRRRTGWILGLAAAGLLALVWGGLYLGRQQEGTQRSTLGLEAVTPVARPLLAVLHFQNLTGKPELDWLRSGLADMLATNLSQVEAVRVLDTGHLHQMLEEMPARGADAELAALAQSVAHRSGADAALLGSFAEVGPTLRINLRVQDVESGEILVSEHVEGQGEDDLFRLIDDLSERLRARFEPAASGPVRRIRALEEVTTSSLEAFRYYSEGSHLLERGAAQEAILLLEKAVELDGEFGVAWTALAVAQMKGGSREASESAASRALELSDRLTPKERLYIQGVYYSLRPQTLLDAVAVYHELLDRFPDHHAGHNDLALLYTALERWQEAIPHYEYLREQGVEAAVTYISLAACYASTGEFGRAEETLDAYLRRHPDSVAGRLGLAGLLLGAHRLPRALVELGKAEEYEPGNLRIADLRWHASILTEDWVAAELSNGRLTASASPYFRYRGHMAQAVSRLYRGELGRALEAMGEAGRVFADSSPETARTRLGEAAILYHTGAYSEALTLAEPITLAPWNDYNLRLDSRLLAALARARLGQTAAAQEELAEVHRLHDLYPAELVEDDRHMVDGLFALALGKPAAAIDPLTRAADRLPVQFARSSADAVAIWEGLATAYLELGRDADALPWLERLSRSRIKRLYEPIPYVRSFYRLGGVLERLGRPEEARASYRRFVDYWGDGTLDRDRVRDAALRASRGRGADSDP